MHPGHATGMDALADAYRFIRLDKEFGKLGIKLTEEQPVAVDWLREQLNGG